MKGRFLTVKDTCFRSRQKIIVNNPDVRDGAAGFRRAFNPVRTQDNTLYLPEQGAA